MARNKLVILDAAPELNDLRIPPGSRLEALKGDRKGQHSIRINDQWRICFKWSDGEGKRLFDCKHDLRHTTKILRSLPNIDVEGTLEFLEEHGGFCDCEVLMNVS